MKTFEVFGIYFLVLQVFLDIKMLFISMIEGLTEFLPVSSTAHILMLAQIMNVKAGMEYIVGIQLGAILAVFILYPQRIRQIIKEVTSFKTGLWLRALIITLPTLVCGFILHILNLFQYIPSSVMSISLILGGIVMLLCRNVSGEIEDINAISNKMALKIGLFQVIALIPGVSRSASVIFGGLFSGLSKKLAIEISFISGVPVIFCASVLEIISQYSQNKAIQSFDVLAINMLISFVFACSGIYLLRWLAAINKDFEIFGLYRIALGFVLLFII